MCNITSVRVHTLEVTDTDEEREADGIITVEKSAVPAYKKRGFWNLRISYTAKAMKSTATD